jgi:hypothetical protein
MNILHTVQLLLEMRAYVYLLFLMDGRLSFCYNWLAATPATAFTDDSHDIPAAVASHVAVVTTGSLPILQQLIR